MYTWSPPESTNRPVRPKPLRKGFRVLSCHFAIVSEPATKPVRDYLLCEPPSSEVGNFGGPRGLGFRVDGSFWGSNTLIQGWMVAIQTRTIRRKHNPKYSRWSVNRPNLNSPNGLKPSTSPKPLQEASKTYRPVSKA